MEVGIVKTQEVQLDDNTRLVIELEEQEPADQQKQRFSGQKYQELWDWMDTNINVENPKTEV
jgi:hypothetical protein